MPTRCSPARSAAPAWVTASGRPPVAGIDARTSVQPERAGQPAIAGREGWVGGGEATVCVVVVDSAVVVRAVVVVAARVGGGVEEVEPEELVAAWAPSAMPAPAAAASARRTALSGSHRIWAGH